MARNFSLCSIVFFGSIISSAPCLGQIRLAHCESSIARTTSLQGALRVKRAGEERWKSVQPDEEFCPGDTIQTGANSRVAILVYPETTIRLDQLSSIVFTQPETAETPLWLKLLNGASHFISREPRVLKILTPFANAAIEGTEFLVEVSDTYAMLTVFEGKVLFSNAAGRVGVNGGEGATARAGSAPIIAERIRPEDAVHWTLYYPPVLDFADEDRSLLAQAAQALSVGRTQQAKIALEKALSENPENSDALALNSIIALTQNDKETALKLASRAVASKPESAAANIAMSYVQQAVFDLPGALEKLKKATEHDPSSTLAWARLAELLLSVGDLEQGLAAAERAIEIDPGLSHTQTIVGFAYLTKLKLDHASAAFHLAIALDQAAPLARLGLGLANIRKGNLVLGREQIGTAVALDPLNSSVRSYMGKAHYEEKRGTLAETQFETAKQLDPKDPTPWFYDAIQKQTTNRPVEALHDLQKAIELNDNRAVYRSTLLLDQDFAARSASLGRIYTDLGFEQRALVEGWYSLNSDPGNYSAHRLLADTYAFRPRHEIARVSELLQAQLLQPQNINNLQPEIGESNLVNLEGAGPANLSFNEFNPLFVRDRFAFQTRGLFGNNGTRADNVVLSGIENRFSYSLGQFHYETDGFRSNNDLEHDIYNVFLQGIISPEFNVQAEYRYRDTDQGDLQLRFDPEDFAPEDRRRVRQETFRLGGRYSISPSSDLIASVIYTNRNSGVDQVFQNGQAFGRGDTEAFQAESQYIVNSDRFNAIAGGGFSELDIDNSLRLRFELPCPPFCPPPSFFSRDKFKRKHVNAYLYTNTSFPSNTIWTFGMSYDTYHQPNFDRDRLNPKIGLQWNITESIRLRTAYLQTVKRPLATDQTIEPTQIAGFNQFFDDVNGTQSERYGLGLDLKISENLYTGAEYSRRNLKIPISLGQNIMTFDRREDLARAYLYWTPHSHWAASVDAEFEQFKRSSTDPTVRLNNEISEVDTLSIPISVRYFHPIGISAALGGTLVHQRVDFPVSSTPRRDDDTFYLLDLSLGYRLPKRFGIISLDIKNLLDENFFYRDSNIQTGGEFVNPRFIPDRTISLTARLAFN